MLSTAKAEAGLEWMTSLISCTSEVAACGKVRGLKMELHLSLQDGNVQWSVWLIHPTELEHWVSGKEPVDEKLLDYVLGSTHERPPFVMTSLRELFARPGVYRLPTPGTYQVSADPFENLANDYIEWLAQLIVANLMIEAKTTQRDNVLVTTIHFKTRGGSVSHVEFEAQLDDEQLAALSGVMG